MASLVFSVMCNASPSTASRIAWLRVGCFSFRNVRPCEFSQLSVSSLAAADLNNRDRVIGRFIKSKLASRSTCERVGSGGCSGGFLLTSWNASRRPARCSASSCVCGAFAIASLRTTQTWAAEEQCHIALAKALSIGFLKARDGLWIHSGQRQSRLSRLIDISFMVQFGATEPT
jgi:hypothetical protein